MVHPLEAKERSKNPCHIKGHWIVELFDENGKLKDFREGHNVICTNGLEAFANFLASSVASGVTFPWTRIAIGSDATAEAASNTALGTELSRTTGVASYLSGAIYQVKATFATGSGTGAIAEYGLFNTSTGGDMLARDTESVVNKAAGDTLVVTHQLTFS